MGNHLVESHHSSLIYYFSLQVFYVYEKALMFVRYIRNKYEEFSEFVSNT